MNNINVSEPVIIKSNTHNWDIDYIEVLEDISNTIDFVYDGIQQTETMKKHFLEEGMDKHDPSIKACESLIRKYRYCINNLEAIVDHYDDTEYLKLAEQSSLHRRGLL